MWVEQKFINITLNIFYVCLDFPADKKHKKINYTINIFQEFD